VPSPPEHTLSLPPTPDEERSSAAPSAAPLPRLLVGADEAGPMCGRSEASWWRDLAAGRIPAPVRLGGRTLWRTEELRRWVEAGCPPRKLWEALQARRERETR
jgi:prophage regulatory protein